MVEKRGNRREDILNVLPEETKQDFRVTIRGEEDIVKDKDEPVCSVYVDGPGLDIDPASFLKETDNTIAMQNDFRQLKIDHIMRDSYVDRSSLGGSFLHKSVAGSMKNSFRGSMLEISGGNRTKPKPIVPVFIEEEKK